MSAAHSGSAASRCRWSRDELADDITRVDLLEMAAPVVQVPQRPPVRHLRFCAVAPEHHAGACSTPCAVSSLNQVARTVVASGRITSGSPPSAASCCCGVFNRQVRRVVPVFRARLGVVFMINLPAAHHAPNRGGFRYAPRRISLPSPHSARYTPSIPGGCRRGPSVPSPGPEHRTGTGFPFSFVSVVSRP